MIWTLIQLLALGFALGVGQRFAQWAPGAFRHWRDTCGTCGFSWADQTLFGRSCVMCREIKRVREWGRE